MISCPSDWRREISRQFAAVRFWPIAQKRIVSEPHAQAHDEALLGRKGRGFPRPQEPISLRRMAHSRCSEIGTAGKPRRLQSSVHRKYGSLALSSPKIDLWQCAFPLVHSVSPVGLMGMLKSLLWNGRHCLDDNFLVHPGQPRRGRPRKYGTDSSSRVKGASPRKTGRNQVGRCQIGRLHEADQI